MTTRNQILTARDQNRGTTKQTVRTRPVYRSEFVIKLQTLREQKRGLSKLGSRRYEFLNENKIEWMPSVDPIIPEKQPRYTVGQTAQTPRTGFIKSFDSSNTKRTTVLFNNYVDIYEVADYDRKIEKTWTRLSQLEKLSIRCELNDFKTQEMKVHRDSRHNTRLHRI